MKQQVAILVAMFEGFSPRDVAALDAWYREDASFKDPFNDVQGLPAIRRVYEHMFATLEQPRFRVTATTVAGQHFWMEWEFRFGKDPAKPPVRGASRLVLADDGRIQSHRDYWDPAEELYERVPVLGSLMRFIKRRLAAPQSPDR